MKYSFIFSALILSLASAAQELATFDPIIVIDEPQLECVYEQYLVDTNVAQNKSGSTILCLGKVWSKYFDYETYREDSTFNSLNYIVTKEMFHEISNRHPFAFFNFYERNLSNNNYTVYESYHAEHFTYVDSVATFSWTLLNDTTTICGHLCHKATTHFRGIEWTVWYANDIPIDAGPWKFNGLPGLILAAEDEEGLRSFSAIHVRKGSSYPILKHHDIIAEMVSREKAVELNRFISLHYDDFMAAKGWDKTPDGSRIEYPKRKFYCPLEKE